jgi:hypothetical protein
MALLAYVVLEGGNSVILILVHKAVLPLSMLVAALNFGASLGGEIRLTSLSDSSRWDCVRLLFVDTFYAGDSLCRF